MIDLHGRNINKLRISLTEVCNMACTYCVTSLMITGVYLMS